MILVSLPQEEHIFFKAKSAIKTQPLASSTTIDYYYSGENVHYDQVLEKMDTNG